MTTKLEAARCFLLSSTNWSTVQGYIYIYIYLAHAFITIVEPSRIVLTLHVKKCSSGNSTRWLICQSTKIFETSVKDHRKASWAISCKSVKDYVWKNIHVYSAELQSSGFTDFTASTAEDLRNSGNLPKQQEKALQLGTLNVSKRHKRSEELCRDTVANMPEAQGWDVLHVSCNRALSH